MSNSRSTSPRRRGGASIGDAAASIKQAVKTTSSAGRRLTMTKSHLRASSVHRHDDHPGETRWNPNWNHFPPRRSLRRIPGAPAGAAWFWGPGDQLGRLNLLTPARVLRAKEEIRTGEIVSVDLPMHEPAPPAFGRQAFVHEIKDHGNGAVFDETYSLNTQSSTQWDGFRHYSHLASKTFYNNTKASDIHGPTANPSQCSIHHWSTHGIAGRALLLDFWHYAQRKQLPYDPLAHDAITLADLRACATHQRIDLRPASAGGHVRVGDILLVRTGFTAVHRALPPRERERLASRARAEATFSGLQAGDEQLVTWLHDCYFAAAASDAPALEVWPGKSNSTSASATTESATEGGNTATGLLLHEYMLALWGMPIGELFDLETLAERCRARERWFFFFTSSPANVLGGVASHVNGQAIL